MDEQKKRRREKRRPDSNCYNCQNAVFDEVFGEYKCRVRKMYIYDVPSKTGCKDYKKN